MAHYNFVQGNQTADSPCGIVGDPDNFPNASNPPDQTFACSSDLTVYMSVDWVRDHIWDNGADPTGAPDIMGVGAAIAMSSSPTMGHPTSAQLHSPSATTPRTYRNARLRSIRHYPCPARQLACWVGTSNWPPPGPLGRSSRTLAMSGHRA